MNHPHHWRLLDTGFRSAAENMALDKVLLECRARGSCPNTLRFLQFSRPAVLVGYHQQVDQEVRLDFCRRNGLEVNRRITGGGAVIFEPCHIGWEIIAHRNDPPFRSSFEQIAEHICSVFCHALRTEFGISATFRPRNDIEVGGRKISGTGGTEEGGAFLFQGTLLVDLNIWTMLRALRVPMEKLKPHEVDSIMERVTTLRGELGWTPSAEFVKVAVARAFSSAFSVAWAPSGLNSWEEARLRACLPEFESWSWIDRRTSRAQKRDLLKAVHRGSGGVIRLMLEVDSARRRIRSALITGDFFAHPRGALYDLESRFKDVPADMRAVQRILEAFFHRRETPFPSLGPGDFVLTFDKALDRLPFLDMGLSPEESNSVFPVCGKLHDVFQSPMTWLLLPYCAKELTCELRHLDGCWQCGRCSMGEGYALARTHGLEPVTIISFEDLGARLREMRRSGSGGFIGCCCEGFYVKHAEDFERAGVPGVLVALDSTTCYDLGKGSQAYRGEFENQTELNLPLTDKVLSLRRFAR